ncbi:unnamed protein product, partial [Adineta ricciae]
STIIYARYIRLPTVNSSEFAPIGTPITQFLDVLPASNWEFSFLTQTPIKSYFLIDHLKGTITVKRLLDRESLCQLNLCSCLAECLIKLEINAISNTSTHILSLPLNILDENDNHCYFSNEIFYINLNENIRINTRIILPIAYDPDLPPNNIHSYELLNNNHSEFQLENHLPPTMIVTKQLDRELHDEYQFILCANEQTRSCCTKIIAKITDVNDNAPKFEHEQQSPWKINVSESTPINTEVVQIKAVDPDEGPNGQIRYSFSKWTLADRTISELFRLNVETGSILLLKELDYEKRTNYQLQIQAKDMGSNALSSYTTVFIQVIDENDCIPEIFIFSPPEIELLGNSSINIMENIPVNTSILYLTVSDCDSGENGRVTVELISSYAFIRLQQINNNTYMFSTNALFDREEKSSHSFSVITYDHGQPSHSLVNTFRLDLMDINDCSPYFDPLMNYTFVIDENNQENFVLKTIQAFDLDENDRISWKLDFSSENEQNLFHLNDQNQLVIIKTLDYEVQSSYHFNLTAEDLVGHRTTIPIDIYLNDVNDNPGRFSTNFTQIAISYHEPPGTFLGHVQAVDKDQNSQIVYNLRPNSMANVIELKPNGSFYTKRKFNQYESYQFDILANDSLYSDAIRIELLIDDRPVLKTPSPYCFPLQKSNPMRIQLEASTNVSFSIQNSSSSDVILLPNGILLVKPWIRNYSMDIYLRTTNSSTVVKNFLLRIQSECQTNERNRAHLVILLLCIIIIVITVTTYQCLQRKRLLEKKINLTPSSFSSSLNDTFFFSSSSPQFTAMTIISSNSSSTHQQTNPSSSLSSSTSSTYIKMSRSFEEEMI